jgi:hypothetical protein
VLCSAALYCAASLPLLGHWGAILHPRSTSLFGRTHSRPSGKVRKVEKGRQAGTVRYLSPSSFRTQYLGTHSSPVLVAPSWALAGRCHCHYPSHSLIVSALHQLSPSTCFLLLDESCKSQRVLELPCAFAVLIIVAGSDKRPAFVFVLLNRREGPPFSGVCTPNSSKQRPHSRLTLLDDNVTTLLTISLQTFHIGELPPSQSQGPQHRLYISQSTNSIAQTSSFYPAPALIDTTYNSATFPTPRPTAARDRLQHELPQGSRKRAAAGGLDWQGCHSAFAGFCTLPERCPY